MKKNNANTAPEKNEATGEAEVMMQAASENTAEIGIILDSDVAEAQTAACDDVSRETPDLLGDTVADVLVPDAASDAPIEAPSSVALDIEDVLPEEAVTEDGSTVADDADSEDTEEEPEEEEDTTPAADPTVAPDTNETDETYKKLGVYVHVPFCKSKCAYCDFYSTDKITCAGRKAPEEMKAYTRALIHHMQILGERTTQYNVDTVFIGGGTPTALPPKLLMKIVQAVDDCFYFDENVEFTVEMNPATANERLLKRLRRAGVNRLSIGLQSSHNHELAGLSRVHTRGDFAASFQMAREAGFDNINIDVMYGIPEQTAASFMETLAFVVAMKPEHISMYNLRIEDGTPLGEKKHMLPLPDEDTECEMYFEGIKYLASHGYKQYEISNFAKEGKECRHNLRYWRGEEYLGCGPASHSFFGGSRFSLKRSLSAYCAALAVKGHSLPSALLDENYKLDKKEEVAEYLMLRLRLSEGISVSDFKEKFGGDFDAIFGKKLTTYIDRGFMKHEDGRYFFTPQGMFVSNHILARIIPFTPKIKRF